MSLRFRLAVLLVLGGICPSAAEDAASKPTEHPTLETYGSQNTRCVEWSDGCAVCARQDGTKIACSLPGIACQPMRLTCHRESAVAAEAPKK